MVEYPLQIGIVADHAGVDLKAMLIKKLSSERIVFQDMGAREGVSVDYPDYAQRLVQAIRKKNVAFGVAICGSGVGMSIAINRYKGMRAALCTNALTAALARRHNDANVICLGARLIGEDMAQDCVTVFLVTSFEGGRHQARIDKLDSCEE